MYQGVTAADSNHGGEAQANPYSQNANEDAQDILRNRVFETERGKRETTWGKCGAERRDRRSQGDGRAAAGAGKRAFGVVERAIAQPGDWKRGAATVVVWLCGYQI